MKATIIIPTYNERDNIKILIPIICALLPEINILVVDDNSPDKTYEVVKEMQELYSNLSLLLRHKKEGLGKAYIEAFRLVLKDEKNEAVIMMDADFSHDPKYLPSFLKTLEECDVVIGSRYINGGGIIGLDMWRMFLSKFGNMYARKIVGLPIYDYTAGFILMKTDYLKRLDLDKICATGYAFLIELKSLLWKADARFKEMPIVLSNRTLGESKMSSHIIAEGILAPWKARQNFTKTTAESSEKYFVDFVLQGTNKIILLDIDGTVVSDNSLILDDNTIFKINELKKENQLFFCSNKSNIKRNQLLSLNAGIPFLDVPHKKPSKKIINFIKNDRNLSILVIGDKFLVDGMFAKNIGANFIKVKRINSINDKWYVKLSYIFDDVIYNLVKQICHI